jgi:hypothetical protein
MTVRDFINYLIYVEHSAENLQFFLWYKDYIKRFESANTADIALAPEWTPAMQVETMAKLRKANLEKTRRDEGAADMFKGTDFDTQANSNNTEVFHHGIDGPASRPSSGNDRDDEDSNASTAVPPTHASSYKTQAAEAFQSAGARQPCEHSFAIT